MRFFWFPIILSRYGNNLIEIKAVAGELKIVLKRDI